MVNILTISLSTFHLEFLPHSLYEFDMRTHLYNTTTGMDNTTTNGHNIALMFKSGSISFIYDYIIYNCLKNKCFDFWPVNF